MQQRSLFSSPQPPSQSQEPDTTQKIYTVSQLNAEAKFLLESTFPYICVEGEISGFKQQTHFYFKLKDEKALINAVMWSSAHRSMKWQPKDGMKVIVYGRLSLFEQNGQYQINVARMVPHGKGDLAAAFEQLKEKLQSEGLFDEKRKRQIPMLPKKIGIVTSRTGAVIRDILHVLNRRYMNLHILIYPAKVQGEDAAPTIVEGIRALNRHKNIDVLILARGGGSIEDLWPFNEEAVARAIVTSRIPVISAVGHETDFTIADFVADLRAPTPSAAAELVIGQKSEFVEKLTNLSKHIDAALRSQLLRLKNTLHRLAEHRALLGVPQTIHAYQQTIDDYEMRLRNGLSKYHQIQTQKLLIAKQGLSAAQLRNLIGVKRLKLNDCLTRMQNRLRSRVHGDRNRLAGYAGKLDSLSPLAVLERGYSIASTEQGTILKESTQTAPGEKVRIRLHRGRLKCEVKEIDHEQ